MISKHPTGRIREPVTTSAPLLITDLVEEVRRLEAEQPWQAEHTAKTIVKFPDLRVVLVSLKAGGRLQEHRTEGRITIHSLSGCIRVCTSRRAIDMPAGRLLTLDRYVVHDVLASSDCVFLLTLVLPIHTTIGETENHAGLL